MSETNLLIARSLLPTAGGGATTTLLGAAGRPVTQQARQAQQAQQAQPVQQARQAQPIALGPLSRAPITIETPSTRAVLRTIGAVSPVAALPAEVPAARRAEAPAVIPVQSPVTSMTSRTKLDLGSIAAHVAREMPASKLAPPARVETPVAKLEIAKTPERAKSPEPAPPPPERAPAPVETNAPATASAPETQNELAILEAAAAQEIEALEHAKAGADEEAREQLDGLLEELDQLLEDLDRERRLRERHPERARNMEEQRDLDEQREDLETERSTRGFDERGEQLEQERQNLDQEDSDLRRERHRVRNDRSPDGERRRRAIDDRRREIQQQRTRNAHAQRDLDREEQDWNRRARDVENRQRDLDGRLDRGEGMTREEWQHRTLNNRMRDLRGDQDRLSREQRRLEERQRDHRLTDEDRRRLREVNAELNRVQGEIHQLQQPLETATERVGGQGWDHWSRLDRAAIEGREQHIREVAGDVRDARDQIGRPGAAARLPEGDAARVARLEEELRRANADGYQRVEVTMRQLGDIQDRRRDIRQERNDLERERLDRRTPNARKMEIKSELERLDRELSLLDRREGALGTRLSVEQRTYSERMESLRERMIDARLDDTVDSVNRGVNAYNDGWAGLAGPDGRIQPDAVRQRLADRARGEQAGGAAEAPRERLNATRTRTQQDAENARLERERAAASSPAGTQPAPAARNRTGPTPEQLAATLRQDASVESARVREDGAVEATLRDGGRVVVRPDRSIEQTSPTGERVVARPDGTTSRTSSNEGGVEEVQTYDPRTDTITVTRGGRDVLRWDRRNDSFEQNEDGRRIRWHIDEETGRFVVTVNDKELELGEGEMPVLGRDSEGHDVVVVLELVPGARGEEGTRRQAGYIDLQGVRGLGDQLGAVIDGRLELNPAAIRRGAGGELELDLSRVPDTIMSAETARAFEAMIRNLPERSALLEAALSGAGEPVALADGTTVELASIRYDDRRLTLDIEERDPRTGETELYRVVAEHEENGGLSIYHRFGELLFRQRVRTGEDYATAPREWRTADRRWSTRQEEAAPIPSLGAMTLRGLGTVAEHLFAPFQSALYKVLAEIQYQGAEVLYGRAGSGLAKMFGIYTEQQATMLRWFGQGLGHEPTDAEVLEVYTEAMRHLTPAEKEQVTLYLDGLVRDARDSQVAAIFGEADAPIRNIDRARMAAQTFGQRNLFGHYAASAREAAARGDRLGEILNYGLGLTVVGGEAFVEGLGFSAALTPLKAYLAGARAGLTTAEVLRALGRAGRIGEMTLQQRRAIALFTQLSRVEMGVLMTPGVISGVQAFERWLSAELAGDAVDATRAFEDVLRAMAEMAGAMAGGAVSGRATARTAGAGETARGSGGAGRGSRPAGATPPEGGSGNVRSNARPPTVREYGRDYQVKEYHGANEPALVFQPRPSIDHNGAFHGEYSAVSIRAQHLVDVSGRPLAGDLRNVAIFRGHGSPWGFASSRLFGQGVLSTRSAARMVAQEIAAYNRTRPPAERIQHVVLDSCSQRDRGWILFGENNAQTFQRYLAEEMASAGMKLEPVVLASNQPGSVYAGDTSVRFTPANGPAAPILWSGGNIALLGSAAAGAAGGSLIVYTVVDALAGE